MGAVVPSALPSQEAECVPVLTTSFWRRTMSPVQVGTENKSERKSLSFSDLFQNTVNLFAVQVCSVHGVCARVCAVYAVCVCVCRSCMCVCVCVCVCVCMRVCITSYCLIATSHCLSQGFGNKLCMWLCCLETKTL